MIVIQGLLGKGIGSGLFRMAERAARERRATRMKVKTEAANEGALGFYRRMGFVSYDEAVETVGGASIRTAVLFKELSGTPSKAD